MSRKSLVLCIISCFIFLFYDVTYATKRPLLAQSREIRPSRGKVDECIISKINYGRNISDLTDIVEDTLESQFSFSCSFSDFLVSFYSSNIIWGFFSIYIHKETIDMANIRYPKKSNYSQEKKNYSTFSFTAANRVATLVSDEIKGGENLEKRRSSI